MRAWLLRLSEIFFRRSRETRLSSEIEHHLDLLADDLDDETFALAQAEARARAARTATVDQVAP